MRNGYHPFRKLEYTFNSDGFRSDEFDTGAGAVFVGCSFTLGVGVDEHETWARIVADQIGLKCYNLGIGGASMDTMFRVLSENIHRLQPAAVFVCETFQNRWEVRDAAGKYHLLGPWIEEDSEFFGEYCRNISDTEHVVSHYNARSMQIRELCAAHNIPVVVSSVYDAKRLDFARDLMHHGKNSHRVFAEEFIQQYRMIAKYTK